METRLHVNATTTPRTRRYIQSSNKSAKELSIELGVSEVTIRNWQNRKDCQDRPHTRHNLGQSMTSEEEELIRELRERLALSYDDITEVMNRCVCHNSEKKLSSSSVHRCVARIGAVKGRLQPQPEKRVTQTFQPERLGYVYIDLKCLTKLESKVAYVFVAIERNTRFVWIDIMTDRKTETVAKCLSQFIEECPYKEHLHTILTDNGIEFTDRHMRGGRYKKDKDQPPTGYHPFDLVCKKHNIKHKLTRPYTPQTNGMVERFNRRLSEAFRRVPIHNPNNSRTNHFANHDERNEYIRQFVHHYNHTRLHCLKYKSPIEIPTNHAGINTRGELICAMLK